MLEDVIEPITKLDHIDYVDHMVRERTAHCKFCGAQMVVGEYKNPDTADMLLAEWLMRHKHGKL